MFIDFQVATIQVGRGDMVKSAFNSASKEGTVGLNKGCAFAGTSLKQRKQAFPRNSCTLRSPSISLSSARQCSASHHDKHVHQVLKAQCACLIQPGVFLLPPRFACKGGGVSDL
eukprot:701849-Pelagomonas_calceolata.AAC.1